MRLSILIGLLTLVLAQAVYATNIGVGQLLRDDCCEIECNDMLGCNETMPCQACTAHAVTAQQLGPIAYGQTTSFTGIRHDRVHAGPARVIWTPPD